MTKAVLDSSALLALLNNEPGGEKLGVEVLAAATCSTVNLAEVHGKLVGRGMSERDAWTAAVYPIAEAAEFTVEHARIAGSLIRQTQPLGLSLGDRASLALGIALNAPIYTADRSWKQLRLPVRIHVIR